MKFLSSIEVGADGFKPEEKASMRYIPSSKFTASRVRIKLRNSNDVQSKT